MVFEGTGIQTRQNGPEKASVIIVLNVDDGFFLGNARRRRHERRPGQGPVLRDDETEGGHGVQYKIAASGVEIMDRQIEVGQQLVKIKVVTAGDVLGMTGEMCRDVLSARFRLSREGGIGTCEDANGSKTREHILFRVEVDTSQKCKIECIFPHI